MSGSIERRGQISPFESPPRALVATSSAMTSERERASSSAHPHRNSTTEHTTGLPDTSSAISFHVGGCDHRVADCSSMLSATAAGLWVDPRRRSRSTVWWSHRVEPRVYSDADARSTTSRASAAVDK